MLADYPGSKTELQVLSDWRRGVDLTLICQTYHYTPQALFNLYCDYLRYRLEQFDKLDDFRMRQEAELDSLDVLRETYWVAATGGDLKAAQFVLAVIKAKADLLERQYEFHEARKHGGMVPGGDVQKAAAGRGTIPERRQRLDNARADGGQAEGHGRAMRALDLLEQWERDHQNE